MSSERALALREEILKKAKGEASKIIEVAESRAKEIIDRAMKRKESEIEEARKRIEEKLGVEAAIVEAKRKARIIIAEAKNRVLQKLIEVIKQELGSINREDSIKYLLKEALNTGLFENVQVIIRTLPSDEAYVREAIKELNIESKVVRIEYLRSEALGGIIIESIDGSLRVDNTYAMRLERILRTELPRISRELFGI